MHMIIACFFTNSSVVGPPPLLILRLIGVISPFSPFSFVSLVSWSACALTLLRRLNLVSSLTEVLFERETGVLSVLLASAPIGASRS